MKIRQLRKGDKIIGLTVNDEPKDLTFQKMDGAYCIATIDGTDDFVNLSGGTELEKVSDGVYEVV